MLHVTTGQNENKQVCSVTFRTSFSVIWCMVEKLARSILLLDITPAVFTSHAMLRELHCMTPNMT